MKEIERRFLVKNINGLDLSKYRKKTIEQSYIYTDEFTAIRKRMICENEKIKYIYTIKTSINKNELYGVEEIENIISKDKYDNLVVPKNVNVIIKDRYYIPLENNLCIELDIFKGVFEGLVFAEIEFPTEELATNFVFPKWFDKELTNQITNALLSRNTREDIYKRINNI